MLGRTKCGQFGKFHNDTGYWTTSIRCTDHRYEIRKRLILNVILFTDNNDLSYPDKKKQNRRKSLILLVIL